MTMIRQTLRVSGRKLTIQLPDELEDEMVEVIVRPRPVPTPADPQKERSIKYLLELLADDSLSKQERKAYTLTLERIRTPEKNLPFLMGVFDGLGYISNDFDDPLPDDILDGFWGKYTDEYGISLDESTP